jgi:endonuclease YncB( thermonuclease family)
MPVSPVRLKKAPVYGAFFMLLLCLSAAAADNCGPPPESELVKVRYAHDGDTVVLQDGTHVRLVGINTPEVAEEGQPAEPLAIRARDHLRQLLFQHRNQVQLLYGEQRQDRYGRSLAYLWLPDGTNIAAELLNEGLGWLVAIPPDLQFLDCLQKSEAAARTAQRGVWQGDTWAQRESASLDLHTHGFQLVRGRITRVSRGGGATWINLQGRFAIRIPDEDRRQFPDRPSEDWVGRMLEVRGWVYQTRGELRVDIGHPANLYLY